MGTEQKDEIDKAHIFYDMEEGLKMRFALIISSLLLVGTFVKMQFFVNAEAELEKRETLLILCTYKYPEMLPAVAKMKCMKEMAE